MRTVIFPSKAAVNEEILEKAAEEELYFLEEEGI